MQTTENLTPDVTVCTKDLVQICFDSREGFSTAAQNTNDQATVALFQQIALERNQQIVELQSLLHKTNEAPPTSGSVVGAAHRTWMDLRAVFGAGASAMLNEAERGEAYLKGKYEEAVKLVNGGLAEKIFHRHLAAVNTSYARIRNLRKAIDG